MTKVKYELEGLETILRRMAKLTTEYPEAVGAALFQEAEAIMAKSVQLCPVDTSALLMSRFIGRPKADPQGISVVMGYGKTYAVYVHEMPADVNWTKPGSGSKFLSRPLDESRRGYLPRLARRVKRNIATGVGMAVSGSNPEVPRE